MVSEYISQTFMSWKKQYCTEHQDEMVDIAKYLGVEVEIWRKVSLFHGSADYVASIWNPLAFEICNMVKRIDQQMQ